MVGNFLFSFTRLENHRVPLSFGFDMTQLGLPAALKAQLIPESFPRSSSRAWAAFSLAGLHALTRRADDPSLRRTHGRPADAFE